MKKIFLPSAVILCAVFAFVLLATTHTSCKKDQNCYATLTVVDTLNAPVQAATVKLNCQQCNPPGSLQEQTGTTDASGKVSFTFRLPAILDVYITHPLHQPFQGILKLEEGKTVEKTYTVQ